MSEIQWTDRSGMTRGTVVHFSGVGVTADNFVALGLELPNNEEGFPTLEMMFFLDKKNAVALRDALRSVERKYPALFANNG